MCVGGWRVDSLVLIGYGGGVVRARIGDARLGLFQEEGAICQPYSIPTRRYPTPGRSPAGGIGGGRAPMDTS